MTKKGQSLPFEETMTEKLQTDVILTETQSTSWRLSGN